MCEHIPLQGIVSCPAPFMHVWEKGLIKRVALPYPQGTYIIVAQLDCRTVITWHSWKFNVIMRGRTYARTLSLCAEEVGHSTSMVTDFKYAFRKIETNFLCTVQKWCLVFIMHTKIANNIIIIIIFQPDALCDPFWILTRPFLPFWVGGAGPQDYLGGYMCDGQNLLMYQCGFSPQVVY